MVKKVKYQQLCDLCNSSDFSFTTTDSSINNNLFMQQNESIQAFCFGLNMDRYNIFAAYEGKSFTKEIIEIVKRKAKELDTPLDLCYIFNFDRPDKPKIITLKSGQNFKNDMIKFVTFLKTELPQRLKCSDIATQQDVLVSTIEMAKENIFDNLTKEIYELGFNIHQVEEGWSFSIAEKAEDKGKKKFKSIDNQETIEKNIIEAKKLANVALSEMKALEMKLEQMLDEVFDEELLKHLNTVLYPLKGKYRNNKVIQKFLDQISEDIIENSDLFFPKEIDSSEPLKDILPILSSNNLAEFVKRYEVNLIVNNAITHGAPAIVADRCDYTDLLGNIIIKENVDVMSIESGLLHLAQGGFLILKAHDLIESTSGWQAIMQTLRSGFIHMVDPSESSINKSHTLEPQKIPANIRVIIIGSEEEYSILKEYAPYFSNYFQFRVDFLNTINYDKAAIEYIGHEIKQLCYLENLKPVTTEALLLAIRKNQDRLDKINFDLDPIFKLIREAHTVSLETITESEIELVDRYNKTLVKKINASQEESYKLSRTLMDVTGEKVGEVNGLCVYEIDGYAFGHPMKISATSYKGKSGVINIEKASNLSGNIYDKGIEIIEGFIGNKFAKFLEPNLKCKLCIEQSYGGIDGDSASSAELYAILSSISCIPVKQNLAVTGSINQYGKIQPVGGLTQKVEGFFQACIAKGELTGDQGVIIPYQNAIDLVLAKEVIEAVKAEKFHIYLIDSYEDGIELLTGLKSLVVEQQVKDVLIQMNL
ncbi:MAG: hypothetical protein ATN31_08475 [Candidatus Epulonipiscioides saccharophilum]|nr:MAG: hypothetical protein ATN31_08475 [Epulopiscium sp. AS2M-Bin001]